MRPRVIIESHIPHVPDSLGEVADVVRLAPDQITPITISEADALIVRTRTRCDRALLAGSQVRFVATATIGTDHLDLQWLSEAGITAVSAPGCNAPAVAQYLFASLLSHSAFADIEIDRRFAGKTIAVIGVGHVGSIVTRWARQLGMKVLPVDPLRAERGESDDSHPFVTLEQALPLADIVTLHVPLTDMGRYPTRAMIDARAIASMPQGVVIVNAARGGIVDEQALIEAVRAGHLDAPIIDCWTGEPDISAELLDLCAVATPHIAGYSAEGKLRATQVVTDALCDKFMLPRCEWPRIFDPAGRGAERVTPQMIAGSYAPQRDTEALCEGGSAVFEALRNNYDLRHEVVDV